MKIISHRGNINGPNPEFENRPEYINRKNKIYNTYLSIVCNFNIVSIHSCGGVKLLFSVQ